ncbi:MAG TPA: ABC transporter ATP-binding protein [Anaerolineaceae bacterium]|nr:ABC transporter ATP-binding protein [Anaerolineaceae bacterium]
MSRLGKYLKPFLPLLLLAILLLFIQANSDLSLPDYMSNIVNYGIQQGGIENAVPHAVRQSEMSKLILFMSQQDQMTVIADYTLIDKNSDGYASYLKLYPDLANEPIFVLKNIDQSEINKLNPLMGKAILAVSAITQIQANPSSVPPSQTFGFDLSKLPPGTNLFALISNMPAAQRSQMIAAIDQKFNAMGTSTLVQAAAAPIKAEYIALGIDTSKLQSDYILHTGLIMLLLTLLSGICTISVGYLSAKIAAGLSRNLRKNVFKKVESFSSTEFDKFSTASLITRSTNDITQIQMLMIIMVRMVFYAPIMGIGGIIRAVGKSSSMWWIIAVAVLVLIGMISIIYSISLPRFKIIQKLVDRLNLVTRENLSGMMVIRAFNMQNFEEKRFAQANKDLTDTNLFVNRVMVGMMPGMMLIMNGVSLLIIWVGASQVAQSAIQVGDMMAFMQYAIQIVFSFMMMSFMFILLPRASVSADRIADVLDTPLTIKDPEKPKRIKNRDNGTVEFRNVCFRYPGAEEDVLHDINFTAKPGQTTALIGATGSGKSTLVNLIPRFYDVTDGSILVNCTDIRTVSQHDLRERIGYVPQKSSLFSGTIESNLRYADENASKESLVEAADIAQATEFISSKPEGLATDISEGGSNVSGGQKQRLSIARALVKKAPIYIFDDSFSALDFKTDAALRRALKQKLADSTLFIVTQRVSTIKNADQILVLDEGRITGKGTHNELMKSCETYREIALSQLSQEELA